VQKNSTSDREGGRNESGWSHYCKIMKQTQEQAGNQVVREMLTRAEQDPAMKARLDRVKALQEELANL
jgi:Trp operon repressor